MKAIDANILMKQTIRIKEQDRAKQELEIKLAIINKESYQQLKALLIQKIRNSAMSGHSAYLCNYYLVISAILGYEVNSENDILKKDTKERDIASELKNWLSMIRDAFQELGYVVDVPTFNCKGFMIDWKNPR